MKNKKERKSKIEKTDLIIFLIVLIFFGFALLGFYPAIMTSDCVDQILQAESGNYRTAHPVFHTFVIGNLAKLGGVWVPALVQIIVFALIWTWGCKEIRKENNSSKYKAFQILFTIFIAIIPLNFMYSITLWKDILYSYSFLAMLICLYVIIRNKFILNIKKILLTTISIVCVMKFRLNGVAVGGIIFAILVIFNIIYQKKIKVTAIFIGCFVVIYALASIPENVLVKKQENVATEGSIFNGTILHTIGAILNSDVQLEQDETEFLDSILNIEEWKKNYNPYTASGIVYNPELHSDVINSTEGKEKLNNIIVKYTKKEPKIVFEHWANVNSIWWSLHEKGGMHGIVLTNEWISFMENGRFDTKPISNFANRALVRYSYKTISISKIYIMMYRPAFAIMVSIIFLIPIIIRDRKNGKAWNILLILPMLLNIGTYVFLITSQDQRYFYPCFMTEYFIILLFVGKYFKTKIKNNEKENKKMDKPKTLIIIPAYNESESIEKVANSVFEQKNENVDVVVVNDGSKDNTVEEAKKTKAIVLDLPSNLGIGGAVQSGYLYAYKNNYDIAIQIDGDGQHDPKYISEMINILSTEDVDMVIGSRFVEKTSYDQTFFRMLGINITSAIIKLFTEKKIYDTTSGYRAVNKDIIKEFVDSYPYDYPEPVTTMQMILKGKKIKEIPVEMNQRTTGVSSISPLKSVTYMIKVTLSLILNSFRK